MNTLFIDTHLWNITIILYKDGLVVDKCEVINKKNNSEYIFPSIVKVIDNKKINSIIVVNGPGSFTGVRLGVTIAKTLAYTMNIPIRTITALECMTVSSKENNVAIDDGNGCFLATFDEEMNLIEDYSYVDNSEFVKVKEKYVKDIELDYELIYKYAMTKEEENAHSVKPIYVKKIGVEK